MSSIVKENDSPRTHTIGVPQDRENTSASGQEAAGEGTSKVSPSTGGSDDATDFSPSTGGAGSDGGGSDESGLTGIPNSGGQTARQTQNVKP